MSPRRPTSLIPLALHPLLFDRLVHAVTPRRLSVLDDAFVRPTATRGTLGGVARATADAVTLCEAAGAGWTLIETVGVGQSEVAVAQLCDCMLLVMPPVGGDELQVIKRGIMEMADIVFVNKADGPTALPAKRAAAALRGTIHFHRPRRRGWGPKVMTGSALTGDGVDTLQQVLREYRDAIAQSGELEEVRRDRQLCKISLLVVVGVVWGEEGSKGGGWAGTGSKERGGSVEGVWRQGERTPARALAACCMPLSPPWGPTPATCARRIADPEDSGGGADVEGGGGGRAGDAAAERGRAGHAPRAAASRGGGPAWRAPRRRGSAGCAACGHGAVGGASFPSLPTKTRAPHAA